MVFNPNKLGRRRFAFSNLHSTEYKIEAQQYYQAKAGGMRCFYSQISGAGVMSVIIN